MIQTIGESVLVLVPARYLDDPLSIWRKLMTSDICYTAITLTKQNYCGYVGNITTNPKLCKVQNGMYVSDYTAGFGNHNYDSNVTFTGDDNEPITMLVTWKQVLERKRDCVMI